MSTTRSSYKHRQLTKREEKALDKERKHKRGFFFNKSKAKSEAASALEGDLMLQTTQLNQYSDDRGLSNQIDTDLLQANPRDSIQSTFLKKSRKTMTKSLTRDINIFNYLKEEKGDMVPDDEYSTPPVPTHKNISRKADSMNDFTDLNTDPAIMNSGNPYRVTTVGGIDEKLAKKKQIDSKRNISPFKTIKKRFSRFASFISPRKRAKDVGSVLGRFSFRSSFNFRSSWGASEHDEKQMNIRDKLNAEAEKKREDDEITDLSGGSDLDTDLLTVAKKTKKPDNDKNGDRKSERKVTDNTRENDTEYTLEERKAVARTVSSTHIDTWEDSDDEDSAGEETQGQGKRSFLGSMTKSTSGLLRVAATGGSDEDLRELSQDNQSYKMFSLNAQEKPPVNDKIKVVNTGRKSIVSVGARLSREEFDDLVFDTIASNDEQRVDTNDN